MSTRVSRGAKYFCVTIVAALLTACTLGGPTYETITVPADTKTESANTCNSPFETPDLTTLTSCGNGNGHCFDADKISMANLAACPTAGQVCVPDKVLLADGKALTSCTFFIGNKPGVCMNEIVPQVGSHEDELKQDVCDSDERCIPCIDPTNGEDTHTCDPQGAHVAACTGGTSVEDQSCCANAGICMDPSAAPGGQGSQLPEDVCAAGKVCAPADLVAGSPTKCSGALGLDGVCIDGCFAAMLKGTISATRGDCGATQICLPCIVGNAEGMPGCN